MTAPATARANTLSRLTRILAPLLLYALYMGNGRAKTSRDNLPNSYLPYQIAQHGTLDLSAVVRRRGGQLPYSVVEVEGKVLPRFPMGTAILAVPPAWISTKLWRTPVSENEHETAEKAFAAFAATLAVCLWFAAIDRRYGASAAWVTSIVLALATPVASCASQGMWSFTGELAMLSASLYFVLPLRSSAIRQVLGGITQGMAFLCRPTALLASCALIAIMVAERRRRATFVLSTTVAIALAMATLFWIYGHPFGAYGVLNMQEAMWAPGHLAGGLVGTLFSPSRGIIPYFPWLLIVPFALLELEKKDKPTWWIAAGAAVSYLILTAGYLKWWGGYALGPRLPTEMFPFATLLLVPLCVHFERNRARIALLVTVALAAATQILSLYNPRAYEWNAAADPDRRPWILWSAVNSQLAATWSPGWQVQLPPYGRINAVGLQDGQIEKVDLEPGANSRYDRDVFAPGNSSGLSHYPRLDPKALNTDANPFRFGPRGSPNSLTTCGDASVLRIPVMLGRLQRVHVVLAASRVLGDEGDLVAGYLKVEHSGADAEVFPLRLNHEVFPYWVYLRSHPPGSRRVYAGSGADSDVLVRTELALSDRQTPVVGFELLQASGNGPCVALLAVTGELAGS
jgi:hypothetical protein